MYKLSFFRQVTYMWSNPLECTYLNIPGIGPGYHTQEIYSHGNNSGNKTIILCTEMMSSISVHYNNTYVGKLICYLRLYLWE